MYFHHTIEYLDGTLWRGKLDHRPNIDLFELTEKDVSGKSVLDIATNDGFFAFWAEQYGKAEEVTAIDVGNYEGYDWGPKGPPARIEQLVQQDKWEVFNFHHRNLDSDIIISESSIYDIANSHNIYDIIFNFGLLYHLRNPIKALDACYSVCTGVMFLETQILPITPMFPIYLDCGEHTKILSITDHNWPTESCVVSWLKKAGFDYIFVQTRESMKNPTRQRFIACVNDEWTNKYKMNENFKEVDESYWEEMQRVAKQIFDGYAQGG